MFDRKVIVKKAYSQLKEKLSVLLESSDKELFRGEIYKDQTKIKAGRLKANIWSIGRHIARKFNKLDPTFIIGYKLKDSDVFFEIWYLPIDGKYIVVDKFGKRTEKNEKFERLNDALDELLDSITVDEKEDDDDDIVVPRIHMRRRIRSSRNRERVKNRMWGLMDNVDGDDLPLLIERTVTSKRVLINSIIGDVKEYKETRMKRSFFLKNKIWEMLLGRDITLPSKYVGGVVNKIFKIIGKDREAEFVVGFTLNNRINLEIWFVKSLLTGRGSFFVFDITAEKVIAKNIKSLRDAYAEAAEKLAVKKDDEDYF